MSHTSEITTPEANLEVAIRTAKSNLPEMQSSADRACEAMSVFKQIKDDETDEKASGVLNKVAKTIEKVEALRKAFTGPLDDIKKAAMLYEKRIITNFEELKAKRNQYANAKAKKLREESDRIESEKRAIQEKIRLKAEQDRKIALGMEVTLAESFKSLVNYWNGINLENFEERSKGLRFSPKLKKEVFDSWLIEGVEPPSYDELNKEFVSRIKPKLDEYAAKLPDKKKQLETASKTEQEEARKREEDAQRKEQEAREEETKKKLEQIESIEQSEAIDAEIKAQVQVQSQEQLSNVRKNVKGKVNRPQALIDCVGYYLVNHSEESKEYEKLSKALQFVLDFCAKDGYTGEGFEIIESITVINKNNEH